MTVHTVYVCDVCLMETTLDNAGNGPMYYEFPTDLRKLITPGGVVNSAVAWHMCAGCKISYEEAFAEWYDGRRNP